MRHKELARAGQGHDKIRQDVDSAGGAAAITGLLRGTGAQLLLAQGSLAFEEVCATCELFVRRMLAIPETPDC
ncbi:hypothetical protein GCM10010276_08610 [Streptomyces longisporus]|uniref:TetR family transcriptional regulator n=1 Tax=Streptomyces longisporus TaxID=1948 RepID=A0ABN3L001_STRLO